jgi:putative hemolysin
MDPHDAIHLPHQDASPANRPPQATPLPRAVARPPLPRLRLRAGWARHADEVLAAQRLRYRVFVEEMGARISPPAGMPPGHDVDVHDRFCEHLLVYAEGGADDPPRVVGTYRVLTPDAARRCGGLYCDREFDLGRLDRWRARMVELGRSCIDADHRTGGAILLLWSTLARFMVDNRLDLMIGCASVPMRDGGHAAASLWHRLRQGCLAPEECRVAPRLPLPVDELDGSLDVEPPPLIKGYLHCGAQLLGAPAWDPDFGTADLPMWLDLARLPPPYRRRFLG